MKPTSSARLSPTSTRADRSATPGLALSGFLPYRLSVLSAVVSEGLARRYSRRFGIAIPEWRVLATIGEFGSITAKAVGLHAQMGKVKVSRAAASLEVRGLIQRTPNPEDLREAFLVLTPSGLATYREIVPLALDYMGRLTADLSAADQDALGRTIDILLARARSMSEGGS